MISTQTIRRPMLALFAGTALLFGGAAMPRFCLHNPTMLYVIGEVRMAAGDHDGGLQMIGFAANHDGSDQAKETSKPVTKTAEPGSKTCTKTPAPVSSPKPRVVAMMRRSNLPSPNQYLQLAKLENVDFSSPSFDEAQFESQMRQAAEMSAAQRAQHNFKKVRIELQRRGFAVPPSLPEPPRTPKLIQ